MKVFRDDQSSWLHMDAISDSKMAGLSEEFISLRIIKIMGKTLISGSSRGGHNGIKDGGHQGAFFSGSTRPEIDKHWNICAKFGAGFYTKMHDSLFYPYRRDQNLH